MKKNKSAFSLVELSIALVVIGLLIASVIKGRALINASKMKSAQSLTRESQVTSIDNMVLWLETTITGSLTNSTGSNLLANNDSVSSWNDMNPQMSTKVNVYQSTSSKMPTFVSDGINGLPSIRFDGVDDMLKTVTNGLTPICQGDKSYTMVIVWNGDSQTTARYIMSEGGNPSVGSRVASIYISNANISGFVGAGNNYTPITISTGKPYITIARINNVDTENVSLWYNSNSPTTGHTTSASSLNLDSSFFEVGSVSNGSANFAGLISEIIIYDRNLNNEEIKVVNEYLSKKYSIKLT